MPRISIIIPVYNVERYLRRCLDSVLAQTFTDWDAICVNDGSPDGCAKILAEYAARDPRFIIITQENQGLSGARNTGMKHANGDYVLFLDSDDFIHPQTMEIAYSLARRDGSDIVAFTYDRAYRTRLMARHFLAMNTDNVVPRGMRHRYNMDKIRTRVTDNIFEYATERTHNRANPNRKWLVKHCQVWKNLYRRELISDIPFIKGILFEDYPWWSRVMLKNPRVTITQLPLYYYIPNMGGIILSEKQVKKMHSMCVGLADAYGAYKKHATSAQMGAWRENFHWMFMARAWGKKKYLKTDAEFDAARNEFRKLAEMGALDNAVTADAQKIRDEVLEFIK